MNTIRKTIVKADDRNIEHRLTFEGEAGSFMLIVEEYSRIGGIQRAKIDLNKQEALKLLDALEKFTK